METYQQEAERMYQVKIDHPYSKVWTDFQRTAHITARQMGQAELEAAKKEIETFKDAYVERNDKLNEAKAEIERLKGLIKDVWELQYPYPEAVQDIWQHFATKNNLI